MMMLQLLRLAMLNHMDPRIGPIAYKRAYRRMENDESNFSCALHHLLPSVLASSPSTKRSRTTGERRQVRRQFGRRILTKKTKKKAIITDVIYFRCTSRPAADIRRNCLQTISINAFRFFYELASFRATCTTAMSAAAAAAVAAAAAAAAMLDLPASPYNVQEIQIVGNEQCHRENLMANVIPFIRYYVPELL